MRYFLCCSNRPLMAERESSLAAFHVSSPNSPQIKAATGFVAKFDATESPVFSAGQVKCIKICAFSSSQKASKRRSGPLPPGWQALCSGTSHFLNQKSFGFFQQKLGLHKRFVADVLPANSPFFVDQKGSMKSLFFEIVVAAISFKDG